MQFSFLFFFSMLATRENWKSYKVKTVTWKELFWIFTTKLGSIIIEMHTYFKDFLARKLKYLQSTHFVKVSLEIETFLFLEYVQLCFTGFSL